MKSLKKWLVVLPLTALLAACNTGGSSDSDLPSGGKATEIVFGTEEVRNKFANDVDAFVRNMVGFKTYEIDAKTEGKMNVALDELQIPFGNGIEKVKASVKAEGLKGELKAGVSFLDNAAVAYANATGSGSLSVSYELPDAIYSTIPAEMAEKYGIKQKNSDKFSASQVGANAYLTGGNLYVNADRVSNRNFAKSVLDTSLVKLPDLLKDMAQIDDPAKYIDEFPLKYVVPGFAGENIPNVPVIPEGQIAEAVKGFLAMVNTPDLPQEQKELVDMVKTVLSTLSLKSYVYSEDSEYSYGFSMGIDNVAQLDDVYSRIVSLIPQKPEGMPEKLSTFLESYGFKLNTFSIHFSVAFGVNGKLFVGAGEEIDVAVDLQVPQSQVHVKGSYNLSTDFGCTLTGSNNSLADKLPSAEELKDYQPLALPVRG